MYVRKRTLFSVFAGRPGNCHYYLIDTILKYRSDYPVYHGPSVDRQEGLWYSIRKRAQPRPLAPGEQNGLHDDLTS